MTSLERTERRRITVVGAGAVGGYFGALLARAGHDVALVARGAHLDAIRRHGLAIRTPEENYTVHARAVSDPAELGPADLVLFAVKTYDNQTALPLLGRLVGPTTIVLTLQNGVDSPEEVAGIVGPGHVIGGAAYIATAIAAPGVIEQTGSYRRIAFGEVFNPPSYLSPRVSDMAEMFEAASIEVAAAPDGRVQLWEKFIYLAPFAGITGVARQPIGVVRSDPVTRRQLFAAFQEVAMLAVAEGIRIVPGVIDRLAEYVDGVPGSMRSSLLIDLERGRPIEVEALQGAVVRRAERHGLAVPVMETLYAVLRAAAAPSEPRY